VKMTMGQKIFGLGVSGLNAHPNRTSFKISLGLIEKEKAHHASAITKAPTDRRRPRSPRLRRASHHLRDADGRPRLQLW